MAQMTMVATALNGQNYEIDPVTKKCRKITSFADIPVDELELTEMSMAPYKKYLESIFPGECVKLRKGCLYFRGYKVYCDAQNGFGIEDTKKFCKPVDVAIEGIPTPRQLGEIFKAGFDSYRDTDEPEETGENLRAAYERGLALRSVADTDEPEEIDLETCRKKVLRRIEDIRKGKIVGFQPVGFSDMIPFRRWKRSVNKVLGLWKNHKIRYKKLLDAIEGITENETFEVKKEVSKFVGTLLPDFKTVGKLVGDKIEVDGNLIDAVPFLQNYLLHYAPRVMPQLMKFSRGEIKKTELLRNPYLFSAEEYNRNALKNTADNAKTLTRLCESAGIVPPQDMLYDDTLKVGDRIRILIDGQWRDRTINSTEEGICYGRGIGVTKKDKWTKIEKK